MFLISTVFLNTFFENISFFAKVTPNEALDKLLKHVENPQKAAKSVNLILQLIKTNVKTIHYLHLFEVNAKKMIKLLRLFYLDCVSNNEI